MKAGDRMRKYIIMGVQGSGKGTQAKLLAETLDLEHISVGDIFRWNVQHRTKLGAQVRRSVAAGELVSDDLVASVVHRRLSEHDSPPGSTTTIPPRMNVPVGTSPRSSRRVGPMRRRACAKASRTCSPSGGSVSAAGSP
jgi:hypothetical protein